MCEYSKTNTDNFVDFKNGAIHRSSCFKTRRGFLYVIDSHMRSSSHVILQNCKLIDDYALVGAECCTFPVYTRLMELNWALQYILHACIQSKQIGVSRDEFHDSFSGTICKPSRLGEHLSNSFKTSMNLCSISLHHSGSVAWVHTLGALALAAQPYFPASPPSSHRLSSPEGVMQQQCVLLRAQ